jgi:hypothetical protein
MEPRRRTRLVTSLQRDVGFEDVKGEERSLDILKADKTENKFRDENAKKALTRYSS